MEPNLNEKYLKAKKRMEEIKGFYWHLFTSVLVLPILAIVNYLTSDYPWALFPIGAFILSICIHWFVVFKRGSFFTRNWEEKKIREFMREDEDQQKQLFQ